MESLVLFAGFCAISFLIYFSISERRHIANASKKVINVLEESGKKIQEQQETFASEKLENDRRIADAWKNSLDQKIYDHRFNLIQERRKHTSYDAYGNEDSTWLEWGDCSLDPDEVTRELLEYNERIFNSGLGYFWRRVILDDPDDPRDFFLGWLKFQRFYRPTMLSGERYSDRGHWFYYLAHQVYHVTSDAECELVEDVDDMTGEEYEEYCKGILEAYDWDVIVTPKTGDQGIDLIGTYGSIRFGFQCKRYSKPVGNSAVQQAVAGRIHHNCEYAAVVTNAGFTQSATQLAESTKVLLLSTEGFENLISTGHETA